MNPTTRLIEEFIRAVTTLTPTQRARVLRDGSASQPGATFEQLVTGATVALATWDSLTRRQFDLLYAPFAAVLPPADLTAASKQRQFLTMVRQGAGKGAQVAEN